MNSPHQIVHTVSNPVAFGEARAYSAGLVAKLVARGVEPEAAKALWLSKGRWVCTRCGRRVDTEGLEAALAHSGSARPSNPTAKALLKGECPTEDCKSGYAWIKFEASEVVDWKQLFEESAEASDGEDFESVEAEAEEPVAEVADRNSVRWWGARAVIGIAALLLVLAFARQLGIGTRVRALTTNTEEFQANPATEVFGAK